jgi:hypothetical protein
MIAASWLAVAAFHASTSGSWSEPDITSSVSEFAFSPKADIGRLGSLQCSICFNAVCTTSDIVIAPQQIGGYRVRRREFLSLVGGVSLSWPLAARAQQPERTRRIGILSPGRSELPDPTFAMLSAFLHGLHELG